MIERWAENEGEIATRFETWFLDLDYQMVDLPVSAADELHRAYADNDV